MQSQLQRKGKRYIAPKIKRKKLNFSLLTMDGEFLNNENPPDNLLAASGCFNCYGK